MHRLSDVTAARQLENVLPFAAHYRQFEPGTEIPPNSILGRGHRRLAPNVQGHRHFFAKSQLSISGFLDTKFDTVDTVFGTSVKELHAPLCREFQHAHRLFEEAGDTYGTRSRLDG